MEIVVTYNLTLLVTFGVEQLKMISHYNMAKYIKFKNDIYLDNIGVGKDIITAYKSANEYITTEFYTMSLDSAEVVGKKLTLKNGKVHVGKGVKKVQASAIAFLEDVNPSKVSYMWFFIKKNGVNTANCIVSGANYYQSAPITDFVMDVKEGDEIGISFNNPNYPSHHPLVRNGIYNTRLIVEVIA